MQAILLIASFVSVVNCEPFNPGFSLRSLTHQLSSPLVNHHSQHQQNHHLNSLHNDILHQLIQRKSDQLATQLKPTVGQLNQQQTQPQQQQQQPQQRLMHHGQQQQVTNVQPQASVAATSDSANLVTDLLANRLAEDRK